MSTNMLNIKEKCKRIIKMNHFREFIDLHDSVYYQFLFLNTKIQKLINIGNNNIFEIRSYT